MNFYFNKVAYSSGSCETDLQMGVLPGLSVELIGTLGTFNTNQSLTGSTWPLNYAFMILSICMLYQNIL